MINQLIKKRILILVILSLFCSFSYASSDNETRLCTSNEVVLAFFNGVLTTKPQAIAAKQNLFYLYGETTPNKEELRYEVLYNYTQGFGDFAEVFEQRANEQSEVLGERFELFFEALRGGGGWIASISGVISSTSSVVEGFVRYVEMELVNILISPFTDTTSTNINYVEHSSRIDNWILEGKKLLFVAHSQGNLFANTAYRYAQQKTTTDSVAVVHVAPASVQLHGPHVLADRDSVIQRLALLGPVPSVTDNIPPYLLRPAGANAQTDILGHGFVEIYINSNLSISNSVLAHIDHALSTLVAPPAEAETGFFTATLTWDGAGDVDLHVYEPSGSHVYYGAKTGISGYLDVDNVRANGPEHYYASCNPDKLLPGTYVVSIANYARAEGRVATVQLASWKDGVLGTRSTSLGEASGNLPVYHMFTLNVSKDEETNEYVISMID